MLKILLLSIVSAYAINVGTYGTFNLGPRTAFACDAFDDTYTTMYAGGCEIEVRYNNCSLKPGEMGLPTCECPGLVMEVQGDCGNFDPEDFHL